MFERVALPTYIGSQRGSAPVRDAIAAWIQSPPLIALVEAWGSSLPLAGSTSGVLRWLDHFSETHWDFRRGVERHLLALASDDRDALVVAAAHALGLAGQVSPTSKRYDFLLILGGLAWTCLQRPAYAAALARQGLEAGSIVGLASTRRLTPSEGDAVPGAVLRTEFDALSYGCMRAFRDVRQAGVGPEPVTFGKDEGWIFRDGPDLTVIAAPSTDTRRRANTRDTYLWWARHFAALEQADRVLIVTTDIYVPYQGADAVRTLGLTFGSNVDVVGVDTRRSDGTVTFSPQQYLQEIRSTIRAFRALWTACES